jgi:hypothetical protein
MYDGYPAMAAQCSEVVVVAVVDIPRSRLWGLRSLDPQRPTRCCRVNGGFVSFGVRKAAKPGHAVWQFG